MKNDFTTRLLGVPGILAVLIMILDQSTKLLVASIWPNPGEQSLDLIPGYLTFVHWRNLGAAWGIFANCTWLLTTISAVASLLLIIFFKQFTEEKPLPACLAGILLGGMLGNFIDRAFYHEGVIDFIFVHYHDIWTYPAFNIADAAICCSILFLIILAILDQKTKKCNCCQPDK